MNGVHDMGGMDGVGQVAPEANEPVFHAPWEGRVMALMRAMGAAGAWNLDMFRDAREHQPATFYLASSYYKSWAKSIEMLMLSRGIATPEEIAAGRALNPAMKPKSSALKAEDARDALKRGSYQRPAASAPRFKVGDRVRARNMHPATHTRLPRYARGVPGIVVPWLRRLPRFPVTVPRAAPEMTRSGSTRWSRWPRVWGDDADLTALKVSIELSSPSEAAATVIEMPRHAAKLAPPGSERHGRPGLSRAVGTRASPMARRIRSITVISAPG